MELLRKRAYARAGLIGNPSDGYHGKTISIIARNFFAEVVLYAWEDMELIPSQEDKSRFGSIHELVHDVELHGYYGGLRLVKATIKKFVEFCENRFPLHERNFSIRYESNIPRAVGMAGSSAIIVATLRALMEYYNVQIPQHVQPSLVLSVEADELGISAGLQDRVIQVYEGAVYMDFSTAIMQSEMGLEYGSYLPLDTAFLERVYIAYCTDVGEPTEVFHNNLRLRYDRNEADVVEAMESFAELAMAGREALGQGDLEELGRLMDQNFDIRSRICELPPTQVEMVERAREVGASAKFAGSGGAIVGVYRDQAMFEQLQVALGNLDCKVFRPNV
ncbi:MAG: GHMP kinase [Planctomycetaceae bacterium]|nr:GHMP kinase [Planctomycetaceae bacterium]